MVDSTILSNIMTGPIAEFLATYKLIIGALIGFAYIALIIILVLNIAKISSLAAHPKQRHTILVNVATACVCLAMLSIFTSLYVVVLRLGFGALA